MRWYKDTTRRNEVRILLQGQSLPPPIVVSAVPLPSLQTRPTEPPPPPEDPLTFPEADDTVGVARVRVRRGPLPIATPSSSPTFHTTTATSTSASTATTTTLTHTSAPVSAVATTSPSASTAPEEEASNIGALVTVVTTCMSRTTSWRHRRAQEAWRAQQRAESTIDPQAEPPPAKRRKLYTCQRCGQPMSKGE